MRYQILPHHARFVKKWYPRRGVYLHLGAARPATRGTLWVKPLLRRGAPSDKRTLGGHLFDISLNLNTIRVVEVRDVYLFSVPR
jgi:hypothetical protein